MAALPNIQFRSVLVAIASVLMVISALGTPVYEPIDAFEVGPSSPRGHLLLDHGNVYGTSAGGAGYGTIYKLTPDGEVTVLVTFSGTRGKNKGTSPNPGLVADTVGNLWGTTELGGEENLGTIFKVELSTGTLTTVGTFGGKRAKNATATGIQSRLIGAHPRAPLVRDAAGDILGTTFRGGTGDYGTVFRINAQSGASSTVAEFTGAEGPSKGAYPVLAMVDDGVGHLWGITRGGHGTGHGTLFRVNTRNGAFATAVEFTNERGPYRGKEPVHLISDKAGTVWGLTRRGGAYSGGTVFKVDGRSGGFSTLASNAGSSRPLKLARGDDGSLWGITASAPDIGGSVFKVDLAKGMFVTAAVFPPGSHDSPGAGPIDLVNDGSGGFVGVALDGGISNHGSMFKVDPGTATPVTHVYFSGSSGPAKGDGPTAGLVSDGAGNVWGTTIAGGERDGGTVFKASSGGALMTVAELAEYRKQPQGGNPIGVLVEDNFGKLWGTTYSGGESGCGTVFTLNPETGMRTKVFDFAEEDNTGGQFVGLANDGLGGLWGTTRAGGLGAGTVFKIDASTGIRTTVAEFSFFGNVGVFPLARLTRDGKGNMWGTTIGGGLYDGGTVFKINTSTGVLSIVASLERDVYQPTYPSELVDDGVGNFWFTTLSGGSLGLGKVFAVNATTGVVRTILEFSGKGGPNRGAILVSGGLVSDGMGNLLGTTWSGGATNHGTIFKINGQTGRLTTLVEFDGSNGANPGGGLVSDGRGKYYGTTAHGGRKGFGTLFKLSVDGSLRTLFEFTGSGGAVPGRNPGLYPAGLSLHTDGNLYGTTWRGGVTADGTPTDGGQIFRIRFVPK